MRPLNMPDVWPVEVNATLVGGLLEGVASLLSSPHLTLQERNVGLNQPRPISKALCEAAATRQEAVLPAGNGVVAHAQVVTQAAAVADLVAVTALCDGLVSSQLLALARREPPSHHHGLSRHAVCSPFACQPHTSPFVCVALSSYRNLGACTVTISTWSIFTGCTGAGHTGHCYRHRYRCRYRYCCRNTPTLAQPLYSQARETVRTLKPTDRTLCTRRHLFN